MSYIVKRGKKYYLYTRVITINDKGKRIKKLVGKVLSSDKQISQEALKKHTLQEDADKLGIVKRNVPIDEFFNRYCKEYSEGKKRQLTILRDNQIWIRFRQTCPEVVYAEQFTDEALINFKLRRKENGINKRKLKNASINRELGMLKNLARWGYKRRYLKANYYDLVEKYSTEDSEQKKPFTDEQFQMLLDRAEFPYNTAYLLGIYQGMRRSEICYLERSDFDFNENTITIKAKPALNWYPKTSGSARILPIHPDIRQYLKEIYDKGGKENKSSFFLYTKLGQLQPGGLTSQTTQFLRELKLPKGLSFHSLRHTFATRIQEGGAPLRKASKLLGHTNTKITEQVYTHFQEREHFDAISSVKINVKLPK